MYAEREVTVEKTLRRPPQRLGPKAATGGVLQKKMFLKVSQYSRENTGVEVFFEETSTQASSYEYCIVYKNTFFEEHLQTAASIERYLNALWTLNVNHVFTWIKSLCSKSVFNKISYYIGTNQLARMTDQWTGLQ